MFIHSKWSCGCSPCAHILLVWFLLLLLLLLFFLPVWYFTWIRRSNQQLVMEIFVLYLGDTFLHLSFAHRYVPRLLSGHVQWSFKFSFVPGIKLHPVGMFPWHNDSQLVANLPHSWVNDAQQRKTGGENRSLVKYIIW